MPVMLTTEPPGHLVTAADLYRYTAILDVLDIYFHWISGNIVMNISLLSWYCGKKLEKNTTKNLQKVA